MNEFKQEYMLTKQKVLDCLDSAISFFSKNEYDYETEIIKTQKSNLENGEFSIAVVGEFSAGKSTFLNALMGDKILPSFTKETTATINFLRHKDKAEDGESGCVYYNDGRSELINSADINTISRYVSTESCDVDVARAVDHLDLFLDSKFLEGNVTLVDTPGLNGIAEGHKELTQKQIEKSSAGIFLFDANQPGSRSDFEFLSELRRHMDSIIFVLNKIDNIKTSEGEDVDGVIKKLKESYKKVYPDETTIPEVWPIAAYPALVARSRQSLDFRGKMNFTPEEKQDFEKLSRMEQFENRLWRFLTRGEKTKQELLTPINQLNGQLKSVSDKLKVEKQYLSGTVDKEEFERQKLELEKSIDKLNDKLNEQTKEIKKSIREAESEFKDDINADSERLKDKYIKKLNSFSNIEEIDPGYIEKHVKKDLTEIAEEAYRKYSDYIQEIILDQTENITNSINETLSSEFSIKFDRKLEIASFEIGMEQYDKKCEDLKKQIEILEQEGNQLQVRTIEALRIKREKEELEKKLETTKINRNEYEINSMNYVPNSNEHEEKKWKQVSRGGVFGKIADFFVGEKDVQISTYVVDDSDRKHYLAQRDKMIANYNSDISEIENKIRKCGDGDYEKKELLVKQKNAALERKRKELEVFQSEFAEKVKRINESQIKRQKDEIEEFIDDLVKDFRSQSQKIFREKRDVQISVISDMVGNSIIRHIEIKKKELEHITNQNNQAESDRNTRLDVIDNHLKIIKSIMSSAFALQDEIDSIQVDIIAKEEI